jgi:hypothetical protein
MNAPSNPLHRVASRPLALCLIAALPLSVAQASPLAVAVSQGAAPAPSNSVGGMGDINLYPKRVVISDRARTGNVGIYNKSATAGDYTITVADMAMTPDGRLVETASILDTDPAKARIKGAADLLRWSPHRFTLPGNESQVVRLMARVAPDLPPGEYRTHFSVIAVPPLDDGLTIDQAAGGDKAGDGIGVRIIPRFGISIPVIIRVGETTLTSGLKDLAVVTAPTGQRLIRLTITRSGTRSSFGDITVTAAGTSKPVALIRGIGVYTEIDERTVLIPVDRTVDARFTTAGARLTATYVDDDHAPGKTLARADFTVP